VAALCAKECTLGTVPLGEVEDARGRIERAVRALFAERSGRLSGDNFYLTNLQSECKIIACGFQEILNLC
jgi:hypothetical protein